MPTWVWIVIAVMIVVAAIVLAVAMAVGRRKRTQRLRERFGPEYERMVSEADTPGSAEKALIERERRHDEFHIVALSSAARQRYAEHWKGVQTTFVDDPTGALVEADRLIMAVMRDRGYPVDDFDQRAEDISVDHPTVVENYRAAHDVQRSASGGGSETEEQRQAFVHYRALFVELLEPPAHHTISPESTQEASA